jgi:hypothetical protein
MKKKPLQTAELLDRWRSDDPVAVLAARDQLRRDGPAPVIQLLRTPDEIEMLRGPIPEVRVLHFIGCAVALNLFLMPFCWTLSNIFGSPLPIVLPLAAEAAMFAYGWENREALRDRVDKFARRQIRHARIAEEAMSLFEDPQWDDAILENLLLKQSDGPDLVRPPAHPLYPLAKRILARMDSAQAALLIPKHHDSLAPFLHPSHVRDHAEFIHLLLEVIGRSGGKEYVRRVRALSQNRPESEEGAEVRQAAVICLQQMEQRFETEKHSRRLLRPSEIVDSDQLVRPAEAQEVDAEVLLRTPGDSLDY